MAVIIDMKMPICCINCRMEGGYCRHNHGWLLQNKKDKDCPLRELSDNSILEDIRAEISEYGSIWVSYTITGHTDSDIQKIVQNVLKQAKEEVLNVIDKHMKNEDNK